MADVLHRAEGYATALGRRLGPLLRIGDTEGGAHYSPRMMNWERSYNGGKAYSQSKIAFGLFGLELARRSEAGGWGITSNLAHPGVAPTNLLAARPEVGRATDTVGVRVIRALSSRGIVVGTVESAQLPALYAATSPDTEPGRLYGPSGIGHLGGPPAEHAHYSRLRGADEAQRVWQVPEELVATGLRAGGTGR
ncbi:hypothetical protein [Lentzea sp. E54]|uniref:hypothetical protein n=1 Tax=Lentzea xerophila TaxID=3435883 RepID=UPI003DA1F64E